MKKLFLFALALAMTANVLAQFNAQTTPLTLEARDANTQVKVLNRSAGAFEYQINGQGTRQSIAADAAEVTIDLPNVGDYVQLWGNQATTCPADWTFSHIGVESGFVYVYGNVMSMVQNGASDFANLTTLQGTWTFCNLFQNDRNLDIHPTKDLVLPATNLTQSCYRQMFYGCRELTRVPTLPATSMVDYCYYGMFYGCKGLTQAPALPATILADYCYGQMFSGCSNLTQAPVLPATSLATTCYYQMFRYCYALNRVVCYATEIGTNSTMNWLQNVAATGTFVKAEGFNGWELNSVNGIPSGWTVEEIVLPSTPVISNTESYIIDTASIALSCATEGASIYYTLDGSVPSATNGTLYAAPVFINATAENEGYDVILKAVVIKNGISSPVVSHTYRMYRTTCTFQIFIDNEELGTASLPASAKYGDEVTMTVSPAIGYELDYIQMFPQVELTGTSFVIPAHVAGIQFHVYFKHSTRNITVNAGEHGSVIAFSETGGAVDLNAPVDYLKKIYLTAIPEEGYEVDEWINYNPETGLTVTEDITISVTFKKKSLVVTFVSEHGQVIIENEGVSADAVEYGTVLRLTTIADEGYEFDHWENYYSGFVIRQNETITAVYHKKSYHVTFVDYDDRVLKEEDVLFEEAATAPADPTREGYTFAGWDKDFSSITAAITVKATYTINTYTVTVVAEHGTVEAKDADNNPVDLSQPIEYGKVIFLTATPDEHWLFDSWENYNAEAGLTVTADVTVTAIFAQNHTGIENINAAENAAKVLIDGQIFILRGEKFYTLQGAEVK